MLYDNFIETRFFRSIEKELSETNAHNLRDKQVFRSIEGALNKPLEVYRLRLTDEKLTVLSQDIRHFKNLQSLEIIGTQLTELPEEISTLENLTMLNISHNKLTTLPESIGNLRKLITFNIYYNKLTRLPESIGNLVNLQILLVRQNYLQEVPDSMCLLKSLKVLDLSGNELRRLPENIGKLESLIQLSLAHTDVKYLPQSIGKLKNLVYLHLNDTTNLSILPSEIGDLKNLEYLDLRNINNLTTLPGELASLANGKLKELKIFDLLDRIKSAGTQSLPIQFLKLNFFKSSWMKKQYEDCCNPYLETAYTPVKTDDRKYEGRLSEGMFDRVIPPMTGIPQYFVNVGRWRGFMLKRKGKFLFIDRHQAEDFVGVAHGFRIDNDTIQSNPRFVRLIYPEKIWQFVKRSCKYDSPEAAEIAGVLRQTAERIFYMPYRGGGFTGPDDWIDPKFLRNKDYLSRDERYDALRPFFGALLDEVDKFNQENNNIFRSFRGTLMQEFDKMEAHELEKGNSATFWSILDQSYDSCSHVPLSYLEPGIALLCSVFPHLEIRTSQSCDGHLVEYPVIDFYGFSNAGFAMAFMKSVIELHNLNIRISVSKINMKEAKENLRWGHWSVPLEFRIPGCHHPERSDFENLFIELHKLANGMIAGKSLQNALKLKSTLRGLSQAERQQWLSKVLTGEADWHFA